MCGRKYMHLTEISAGFFFVVFVFPIHFIKEGGGGGGGGIWNASGVCVSSIQSPLFRSINWTNQHDAFIPIVPIVQIFQATDGYSKNMERFTNLRVILAQGPC